MSLPYVANGGMHEQLEWIGGHRLELLLDGARTEGQVTVVRSHLGPGSASPLHVHRREDEIFVVLTGEGLVWVGEERHDVGPGSAMFLPRNVPHAYRFTSTEVDFLTICTPSGMEDFFRGAGRPWGSVGEPGWEVTTEALVAAAAAGGQEILGPPPSDV